MQLDFSRCRSVWVPGDSENEGFWSPPPAHVRVGVQFIMDNPYAILADDMGGMKTAQSIIAAQLLHDAGVIDRVIVVAPAAVRPKVWFDQDLGQLREQVFEDKLNIVSEYHSKIRKWEHGPKDTTPLKWIVTNYEFIRTRGNLLPLLSYCGPKTFLILDESSAVRGYDSAQTEACMLLRWKHTKKWRPILGLARCGRVLEMNGTPVAEGPMDLFSQGNLLHPSILDCKYVTNYRARYAVMEPVRRSDKSVVLSPFASRVIQPDGTVKMIPKAIEQIVGWSDEGLKDLQQRFAPYVLRREAKSFGVDFALPPVGFDVPLTEPTWKIYRKMRDEMVAWLESGVATAATAAIKVIRLAQITSGFLGGIEDANIGDDLFIPGVTHSIDGEEWPGGQEEAQRIVRVPQIQEIGREKLDFALAWHAELLKHDPNLKLLTWCRFVPELRRYLYEERLTFPSIPVGAACGQKVLGGEQSQKTEREFALRLLHPKTAPEGAVTVGATQGTGAMGLNLTACRTVLDMSYDYSPWKKRQGDARVNRPGQTGPVSFFYLVAIGPKGQKTIDHQIMLKRLGKMNVIDMTVAGWVRALKEE